MQILARSWERAFKLYPHIHTNNGWKLHKHTLIACLVHFHWWKCLVLLHKQHSLREDISFSTSGNYISKCPTNCKHLALKCFSCFVCTPLLYSSHNSQKPDIWASPINIYATHINYCNSELKTEVPPLITSWSTVHMYRQVIKQKAT